MRKTMMLGAAAVAGTVLVFAGCSAPPSGPTTNLELLEATNDAQIVLVAMHADWCATCQRLEPSLDEAAEQLSNRSVAVVKADLTNRRFPEGETKLAEMGLTDLYERNKGKTGLIYILDGTTGELLGMIEGRATRDEILTRVNRALDKKLADA